MNYTTEIIIRNYKIALLSDSDIPFELRDIGYGIQEYLDNLTCLVSDNPLYKEYEFYIDKDCKYLDKFSFRYCIYDYAHIVDITDMVEYIERKYIYLNKFTHKEFEELIEWYYSNIMNKTVINLESIRDHFIIDIINSKLEPSDIKMTGHYIKGNSSNQLIEEFLETLVDADI